MTHEKTDREGSPPDLVAVLDMGASAIRLVVAEIGSNRSIRIIEEASRGVLLGRDTFSSGAIRSNTIDAALAALDNFRHIIDGYGECQVRAVATSAVREARNVDTFLDRIQRRTGIAFEIINTDFGLLTTSQAIAEDATAFFSALTGYSDPPRLKKLVMAPTELRRRFLRLIARERLRAEADQAAEIVAKMNSLIDEEIIDALYAASRSGVSIRLNVRGICALRPGLPDVSANIDVISIVDRFLEHSRIYYFLNGGEEEVYLASADWMTRNLDKRVELMFPVEKAEPKAKVLYTLRAMFRDTTKARWLGADGVYRQRQPPSGEPAFRVQQHLQEEAERLASLAHERAGVVFRPEQRDGARVRRS